MTKSARQPSGAVMPEPRYLAIAMDLESKIRDRTYPPGSRLPSTSRLTEIYGVSETVIRYVMVHLRAKNLVEGEAGRAVFVLPRK